MIKNTILVVLALGLSALSVRWRLFQPFAGAAWGIVFTLAWKFVQDVGESGLLFGDLIALHSRLRRTKIRLSISALLRIRDGDRYLLVKSSRIPDQYQPVGGAIKFFESARPVLSRFGADFDTGYGSDPDLVNDLRLNVPGRFVARLLRWFRKAADRECGPWREFHEELIETQILSSTDFPWLLFRKVDTYIDRLHFSDRFQRKEILIAEIFEPIISPTQKASLVEATKDSHDDDRYKWINGETLRRLGGDANSVTPESRIGKHSQWIMEGGR